MTNKQRFLTAMTGGVPDRVPCAPDFSNMIPCRRTGKPFWDIYLHQDPPLWRAYLDAARYFGIDAWFMYGGLPAEPNPDVETRQEIVSRTGERIVQRTTYRTPQGDLWTETTYYRADPPTTTRKLIKDPVEDIPKLEYLLAPPVRFGRGDWDAQREAVGDLGLFGPSVGVPGLHMLNEFFDGNLTAATYAMVDYPALVEQLIDWHREQCRAYLRAYIAEKPDFVLLGASGLLTLQSWTTFEKWSLPVVAEFTRDLRAAGIPSMLHSCGKERRLVDAFVEHTDLDCVNPLEIAPMGDCDLREVKQSVGDKIALMGNLHTTQVMLQGSPDEVEAAALDALDAAQTGGGFIMSTGDQCGRDTPEENLFRLVEVTRRDGKYA
jgi:uroporphyrinogen decarboxylase